MRICVQRVLRANCLVDNKSTGKINKGFMLLVGFTHDDNLEIVKKMAKKVVNLRIFEDENQKLNLNINQVSGEILAISQFTLYADCSHGNRPSFTDAMNQIEANNLYIAFCEILKKEYLLKVEMGIFGADMNIDFINDGPVTILLDSKEI